MAATSWPFRIAVMADRTSALFASTVMELTLSAAETVAVAVTKGGQSCNEQGDRQSNCDDPFDAHTSIS